MAFQPSYNSRVLIGSFAFSAYVNDVQFPTSTNMLDVTTLANTAKTFIPGQVTSTASLKGYLDPDTTSLGQYDQINTFTSTSALAYAPRGFAFGNEAFMVNALRTSAQSGAGVGGAVTFDLACQTALHTDFGYSLHDLTAETSTGSSAALNGAASSANGGVAQLHVTAFSGFTGVAFIVEDSANGTTGWATIATFTNVTGLTSERITITGTIRQYTRVTQTVSGTGSVTFQAGIARR